MSDDRDWDAELEAAAGVRRRYRDAASSDAPPAALDDAILAASRRAVSAGPVPVGQSSWRRWRAPLAAAAVIVVSASVGLLMWEEKGHEQWPSADRGPAPEAVLPAPMSVSPDVLRSLPPAEVAAPEEAAAQRPADRSLNDARPTEARDAPAYALSRKESLPEEEASALADRQPPPAPASVPPAAPAPSAASSPVEADDPVAKVAEPNDLAKASGSPANADALEQRSRAGDPSAVAKSAARRPEAEATERRELFSGTERAGRLRGSAPAAAAPAAAPRVGRNDDGVEELRDIAMLWEVGLKAEAVADLRRLRCSKPHVPIPPDFPVPLGPPLECPQAAKEPSAPDR